MSVRELTTSKVERREIGQYGQGLKRRVTPPGG